MGDFYGTGIEIWAGFGPIGSTEKKRVWADYEQHLRPVFSCFHGQNKIKKLKHCSVCTKKMHKTLNFFFLKKYKHFFTSFME